MVAVPFERLDIEIPEDLVEEVARIVGYEKIPTTLLPPSSQKLEISKNFYAAERMREELIAKGYSEVYTSVFAAEGERVVLNKVDSVRPYLRANLVDGLGEALQKNIRNKELLQLTEAKLFEIGPVWKGGKEVWMVGTVSEKEKASEKLLEPVEAQAYEDLPLSTATRYQPFSRFPYIVRDVALWVPKGTSADSVLATLRSEGGDLLQKSYLFDKFSKGEKTSFAFRLVFQSFDRTLLDSEVNAIMEKVSAILKKQGFEIR